MAPAMSTHSRIAGERPDRSGEFFTRSFGWTKPAGAFPHGGTASARATAWASYRRPADGDGRPS